MDLAAASDLAQVIEAAAVLGGVLFAVVQLRQIQRQRQDAGAQIFIQQWGGDRMRDLDLVYALPDAATPEIIERDPDVRRAADAVYVNLEQLGLLVHQRTIALRTANEWAGGAVRVCWRKLHLWIAHKRRLARSERPGEWFQWLVERMAELPDRAESTGAHVAHRGWRP